MATASATTQCGARLSPGSGGVQGGEHKHRKGRPALASRHGAELDGQVSTETPRRGRPRSERARHAILNAAADLLLLRGLDAVSMDAVAESAGVSKATIYRWWPSKQMLALDALLDWATAAAPPRDTGSLRGDVLALVRPWVREIRRRPFGRVIAAFVNEAQSDPEFADAYRTRFVEPRREAMRAVLARAAERGEVPVELDVEVALDLIYGAVYHRLLHGHAALTEHFAREVVDLALNGILTRSDR
jgi:AcrR family transcriptional regulator